MMRNIAIIAHVDSGEVEPKEAYMKAVEKQGFVTMLKARNLDVRFAESDQASAAAPPSGQPAPSGIKSPVVGKPMATVRR